MSLWHHAPVIHADDKSLVANLTEVENAALSKGKLTAPSDTLTLQHERERTH
jgi:hypothetical protein